MNMFKPFLGRIIVESVELNTQEYLKKVNGIKEDSILKNLVFAEGTTDTDGNFKALNKSGIVPITTGRIVVIGDNSFGERFEKWYGKDCADEGRNLKPGDIVKFVENQTNKLDPEGRYFMISDEHILGYIKAEEFVYE